MTISVRMSVCLSDITNHKIFYVYYLPMAAGLGLDSDAIRYALPVFQITSRLPR